MAWAVCLWGWVPRNCWALSCCLWGCCVSSKQLLLLAGVLSSCVSSCGFGFQAVVVGEAAWLALVAPCASPRPLRRSRSTQEITGSCSCRQPTCHHRHRHHLCHRHHNYDQNDPCPNFQPPVCGSGRNTETQSHNTCIRSSGTGLELQQVTTKGEPGVNQRHNWMFGHQTLYRTELESCRRPPSGS